VKLKHLQLVEDDSRVVAAEGRETWEDAIAAYFSRRKKSLEADYAGKASFDRSAIRLQAKALPEILQLLTRGVMSIPDKPTLIERRDDEDSTDHIVRLATLLTPPGWQEHVRPVLLERRATAMSEAFDEKDEEANVALITEIDYLLRFLTTTDTQGSAARAQRRGMSPRAAKQLREAAM
jgi:hypothetical protein